MIFPFAQILAVLLGALLLVSCNRRDAAQQDVASQTQATVSKSTISGQVFIVTKGRDNIKLALVEVAAIPEQSVSQHIKIKHENGLQQQKLLLPAYEAAKKEYEKAEAVEVRNAEVVRKRHDSGRGVYVDQWAAWNKASAVYSSKRESWLKIKNQYDHFDSGQFYFEKLPASAAVSKTDADGKFGLSLTGGKYVIAATTSRQIGRDEETYYWLIFANTSTLNQPLMLSNDNEFATKCKECVQANKIP